MSNIYQAFVASQLLQRDEVESEATFQCALFEKLLRFYLDVRYSDTIETTNKCIKVYILIELVNIGVNIGIIYKIKKI